MFELKKLESHSLANFRAMASPCEVIIYSQKEDVCRNVAEICAKEAFRIESKFSRYRTDNIIHKINTSKSESVEVDEETAKLLDFAQTAYDLSGGAFDVTSGVLRKIWKFDGSENIPSRKAAKEMLQYVGWDKVSWDGTKIQLEEKMQIDLGGIGKEYAVDSALKLVTDKFTLPVMVNFGGDLAANLPPLDKNYWSIGVEEIKTNSPDNVFRMKQGAIATSGDANRYLLKRGKRLSHILNPRTAWPVSGAPRSITVGAATCIQAGMLSSIAMLNGDGAENFLKAQEVSYYIQR